MALNVGKDYVYLCIGIRCWGKGLTEKLAKTKARQNGSAKDVKSYNLFLVPPSAYVNAMGDIYWKEEEGKPKEAILIKTVRDGKDVIPKDETGQKPEETEKKPKKAVAKK